MRNTFTFGGILSSDYGVYISGTGVFNAPERDVTTVEIPGRDGVLTLDNGRFREIAHTYPAFVVPPFKDNIRGLRNALLSKRGLVRLSDTYHSDEYYLAYYEKGLEAEPTVTLKEGELEIEFTRDPRRFLLTGETPIEFIEYEELNNENDDDLADELDQELVAGTIQHTSATITNPTLFPARPLITATGPGIVTIGDQTITVNADVGETIYIDCEMMDAYTMSGDQAVNANGKISLSGDDFPVIPAGDTVVSFTTAGLEIVPRWWRL